MGRFRFLLFYLLTGRAAAGADIFSTPGPRSGRSASGAISSIMGAYLVLYPGVRVHTPLIASYSSASTQGRGRISCIRPKCESDGT